MRRFGLVCLLAASALAAATGTALADPSRVPPGASSCSGCHALQPVQGQAVPPIAARPASEIAEAMAAFRAGERPATIMTRIARGFTPEETQAIAEWLEQQR